MVLLTGGCGYIGSHIATVLENEQIEFLIVDNFINSRRSVIDRIKMASSNAVNIVEGDVRDVNLLERVIRDYQVDSVIHLAALKAVPSSATHPLEYYDNNVGGIISVLQAMQRTGVCRLVFSSSAAVYGSATPSPISEVSARAPASVYGKTKALCEDIILDAYNSMPDFWRVATLRYFNPIGAHPTGLIGDDSVQEPGNLMPMIMQVVTGKRPLVNVFGDDYDTKDGSGIRDFIHVMDLAEGHLTALNHINANRGAFTFNLGTGRGTSVLELISECEKVSGTKINITRKPRRAGDVAECWADNSYATDCLNWTPSRSLRAMCEDSWRWEKMRVDGVK